MKRADIKGLREFLSLTQMCVEIPTHTMEGCDQLMDAIIDLFRKRSVGDIRKVLCPKKVLYPKGAALWDDDPRSANLVLDIGPSDAEEMIVFETHMDNVGLQYKTEEARKKAYSLRPHRRLQHVYYGHGISDTKAMLAAQIQAALYMKLMRGKKVRFLWPTGEEGDSWGTWAGHDLLKGASEVHTGEIRVGGKLTDAPGFLVTRKGRMHMCLHLQENGKHLGYYSTDKRIQTLITDTIARATLAVHQANADPVVRGAMRFVVPEFAAVNPTKGMKAAEEGVMPIEIHIQRNMMTQEDVAAFLTDIIQADLPPHVRKKVSVEIPASRKTPFLRSWQISPHHPAMQRSMTHFSHILQERGLDPHLEWYDGGATAEEWLLGVQNIEIRDGKPVLPQPHKEQQVPVICSTPIGEGEHGESERAHLYHSYLQGVFWRRVVEASPSSKNGRVSGFPA